MQKKIKFGVIVLAGIILIVFATSRMGLFPSKEKDGKNSSLSLGTQEVNSSPEKNSLMQSILSGLDSGKESNSSRDEEKNDDASDFEKSLECFYVEYAVDGDTIFVSNDEHPNGIKVRYIGIDTPELYDENGKRTDSKEGNLALERNEELILEAGNEIYLEYDESEKDKYGRTLAYVYTYDFESGKYSMIQKILLKEGLCICMEIEPNTKYKQEFKTLEEAARREKVGLFGTGFY